ncbi:potassium channel family protein [Natrarchaeobaculum sulfurireducens]|uniref:PhoU-like domain fused to TrkA-C domain n=1 Tax=Natrarchaeobaculum sulfurireducens TaxID=2044521 RepID=A0A346PIX3_9EURY|nr:TrkA C-terminal domain-containing protein [Natrarchaeobaculum sulfurireducens]AXR79468.1 PhoU-like domain fused to TrkA-C domain [Natrarchaeobaculum sulfurireducens]AXR83237.1 Potassium channel protein [Natrarchaeobaculum sulfurireducens]
MDPLEGEASSGAVEYEPVSVKDVLVEMKDTAELLIDLSYSAVLHSNEALAREVLRLEERMDVLELKARMSLMMAVRNPGDAEQLAPVLGIVAAAGDISDAAGDIAKIVLEEMGLPDAMRAALPEAAETLVRGVVGRDSPYANRTLADIDLESGTGVRVIALRRGDEWLLNPGPSTTIETDDVALLRGPETAIDEVYESLTGEGYESPDIEVEGIADLERAVDTIVHMKNLSELAVDLAYSSVLFGSEGLAEEVRNLEIEVDAMESRFEAWTLRAAADAEEPVTLRGLIRLGSATEVISDAAIDISEGVLRDLEVHPVVRMAVEESDEIISRLEIEADSDLDGVRVTSGVPDVESTMSVIAIRRPGEGWILVGDTDVELQTGDVLISKGTRTAAEAFESLAAD